MTQYIQRTKQALILPSDGPPDELRGLGLHEPEPILLASPLLVQEKLIGVLIVTKETSDRPFALSDRELLAVLSGQAAIAIQNARLFEEIQRAYRELQELDRLKSEFVNIAAHELRTPLAILLGYLSILQEEVEGHLAERVQIITRNGLRLRSIIDDLLNLRDLESGLARLKVQSFSVKEAIESTVADLRPLAEDKQQDLILDISDNVGTIQTDPRKFNLIVVNLVSNAIKFTPASGKIRIEARPTADGIEVSVIDNGIGISEEERERIFSRFYQVGNSTTRAHGGMGIGLSIAKGMVELCGGRITVESEVNKGSKFTFNIPQSRMNVASPLVLS